MFKNDVEILATNDYTLGDDTHHSRGQKTFLQCGKCIDTSVFSESLATHVLGVA